MTSARETTAPDPVRPKRYGRWRAATLATVYVLMGIHIAHWKLAGKTLAPLELNEVMHTLELGIVTAGFLFMCAAVLSVVIFGRFFCSWGCHILALEDLSAWILGKLRIKVRPVRSRLLLFVPPFAMFYMFLWPQVKRLWQGDPAPEFRILSDAGGWASFVTTDYWRNLPEPIISIMTFAICGFLIVYVLGSRSFCTYGCPYGVVFALADRVAPGRILLKGNCTHCRKCTAACTSGIRVHEEVIAHGKVVSPSCMKDMDCVMACPEGALGFGFSRPAFFKSWGRASRRGVRYHFTFAEEFVIGVAFLVTLLVFRGLYGYVPFLMTLGLGCVLAAISVSCLRLVGTKNVKFRNLWLRRSGRITRTGRAFVALSVVLGGFTAHSGVIRYHEASANGAFGRLEEGRVARGDARAVVGEALENYTFCARWGVILPPYIRARSTRLHVLSSDLLAAEGRLPEALDHLRRAEQLAPGSSIVQFAFGVLLAQMGQEAEALRHYQQAARLDPQDAEIQNNLGFALALGGDLDLAERHLRKAIELDPDYSHPHFNLGRLLHSRGKRDEAGKYFRRAANLDPRYAKLLYAGNGGAVGPSAGPPVAPSTPGTDAPPEKQERAPSP